MAREKLERIGGRTTVRFYGADFKPSDVARLLNALQGAFERAAALELRETRKPRIHVVVTRLGVENSWDVAFEYAVRAVGSAFESGPELVSWGIIGTAAAGRIVRSFRRIGLAHGRPVEIEADAEIEEAASRDEAEDPRFADSLDRLWRATLECADGAELVLEEGRARIIIPGRRGRK